VFPAAWVSSTASIGAVGPATLRQSAVIARLLGGDGAGLEQQDAGDDLEAVGDAMLHLLQQHLLLPQQFLGVFQEFGGFKFEGAAFGDVEEGEQDRVGIGVVVGRPRAR
jgi:hypothetical protein